MVVGFIEVVFEKGVVVLGVKIVSVLRRLLLGLMVINAINFEGLAEILLVLTTSCLAGDQHILLVLLQLYQSLLVHFPLPVLLVIHELPYEYTPVVVIHFPFPVHHLILPFPYVLLTISYKVLPLTMFFVIFEITDV